MDQFEAIQTDQESEYNLNPLSFFSYCISHWIKILFVMQSATKIAIKSQLENTPLQFIGLTRREEYSLFSLC